MGKPREPKVRTNSSTGTLLPILDVTVTIVSDTEIETIDLIFIVELGVSFLPLKVQDERRAKNQPNTEQNAQANTVPNAEPNRVKQNQAQSQAEPKSRQTQYQTQSLTEPSRTKRRAKQSQKADKRSTKRRAKQRQTQRQTQTQHTPLTQTQTYTFYLSPLGLGWIGLGLNQGWVG